MARAATGRRGRRIGASIETRAGVARVMGMVRRMGRDHTTKVAPTGGSTQALFEWPEDEKGHARPTPAFPFPSFRHCIIPQPANPSLVLRIRIPRLAHGELRRKVRSVLVGRVALRARLRRTLLVLLLREPLLVPLEQARLLPQHVLVGAARFWSIALHADAWLATHVALPAVCAPGERQIS